MMISFKNLKFYLKIEILGFSIFLFNDYTGAFENVSSPPYSDP